MRVRAVWVLDRSLGLVQGYIHTYICTVVYCSGSGGGGGGQGSPTYVLA